MIQNIIKAIEARSDLKAWSVEHIKAKGGQQYDLSKRTEAIRSVETERYVVNLLRETNGPDGDPSCGTGSTTILPSGEIEDALNDAALTAGLVHNEPYHFPESAPIPDVPLSDDQVHGNPAKTAEDILGTLKASAAKYSSIRLTASECFVDEVTTRLVNSRGIDATQIRTDFHLEFVFIAGEGDEEVETFVMLDRRRAADLDVEGEVARRAQYASDLLIAGSAPEYSGPVIVQGGTLGTVVNSSVIKVLSQAESKYTEVTPWEIREPIFRIEVKGDPLNIWANRQLAYGSNSNRFDREGIPSQRVELIRNNKLVTFTASQRFSEYLGIPATGEFGDIEVGAGSKPASDLLEAPHVEVVEFSWFNPDAITGDFACEIRLGYIVEGKKRSPFKGGMLVGNLLDGFATMNWSAETDFYGDYLGPTTALFHDLKVAKGGG